MGAPGLVLIARFNCKASSRIGPSMATESMIGAAGWTSPAGEALLRLFPTILHRDSFIPMAACSPRAAISRTRV